MEKLARRSRGQVVSNHNTPRTIRTRLSNPRRSRSAHPAGDTAAPQAPPAVPQEMALSASGRMALGPWLGTFGSAHEDAPSSPTMFANRRGRVFSDLEGSPVASADLTAAAAELEASQHHSGGQVVAEGGSLQRLALREEVAAMRRKAEEGRGQQKVRAPRANVARRRYRMIGQARKAN